MMKQQSQSPSHCLRVGRSMNQQHFHIWHDPCLGMSMEKHRFLPLSRGPCPRKASRFRLQSWAPELARFSKASPAESPSLHTTAEARHRTCTPHQHQCFWHPLPEPAEKQSISTHTPRMTTHICSSVWSWFISTLATSIARWMINDSRSWPVDSNIWRASPRSSGCATWNRQKWWISL